MLLGLAGAVKVLGLAYFAYDHYFASKFISTDNAYTAVETAQVTPAIGGIVSEVRVTDTSYVHKGDVLVVLDDIDARLALAQAEAELGRAERRVRGYVANDASLAAQLAARAADEKRAAADLERATIDLQRRENLAASGSVSGDELTKARNAYESAKASLAQARSNYSAAIGARSANAVLIENATENTNPEVLLARARRDQAQVNLDRTIIRAPVDGVVAKRSVQVGQQIQPGTPVLAIVPHGRNARGRELQGRPARARAHRPARGSHLGSVRQLREVPRHGRGPLGRHRLDLRRHPGAERHGQLDQGGPARAGAHQARAGRSAGQSAAGGPVDGSHHRHPCQPGLITS